MFTCRVIDGKGEFASDSNEASRNVCPRNGARVPGIDQQQNRLEGDPYRFPLVCHDFEAFVDISIDAFDQHGVVVPTGEDVTINLEEI
jgi:hypothetical protein